MYMIYIHIRMNIQGNDSKSSRKQVECHLTSRAFFLQCVPMIDPRSWATKFLIHSLHFPLLFPGGGFLGFPVRELLAELG